MAEAHWRLVPSEYHHTRRFLEGFVELAMMPFPAQEIV